jgi:hypothetical protein
LAGRTSYSDNPIRRMLRQEIRRTGFRGAQRPALRPVACWLMPCTFRRRRRSGVVLARPGVCGCCHIFIE